MHPALLPLGVIAILSPQPASPALREISTYENLGYMDTETPRRVSGPDIVSLDDIPGEDTLSALANLNGYIFEICPVRRQPFVPRTFEERMSYCLHYGQPVSEPLRQP